VIRPFLKHTEGYAVLREEDCKIAFDRPMRRLKEEHPAVRQGRPHVPRTIVLSNWHAAKHASMINQGIEK
jgi:hypothetical protein